MYIVRSVFADPSYNQAESRLMIRMGNLCNGVFIGE